MLLDREVGEILEAPRGVGMDGVELLVRGVDDFHPERGGLLRQHLACFATVDDGGGTPGRERAVKGGGGEALQR